MLVVDDEHDAVAFLDAILKEQGFEVISANDGEACLNKARFDSPDLVILDVELPKINGFDVFKMLRDDERTEHIPVIILTGIEEKLGIGFSKEGMKDLYHEEPQAYLEKPIEPDIVISTVKRILQV